MSYRQHLVSFNDVTLNCTQLQIGWDCLQTGKLSRYITKHPS